MDNTRQPTQDGQTDVDQEVSTTSALQEDAQRRQDDGEDDLADVAIELRVSLLSFGFRGPSIGDRIQRESHELVKHVEYGSIVS